MSILLQIKENINTCKNCGKDGIILDLYNGERICNVCGIVIEDQLDCTDLEIGYSMRHPNSNVNIGMPSMLAQPDQGLSTQISLNNTDAFGATFNPVQISKIRRLRNLDKISKNNRNKHRNLKNAFAILGRIKDKLSMHDTIIERSAYYYRKILNLGLIKGRSIKEFIVACVYISCRMTHLPRTLDEIAECVNADCVFAGKCYRLLIRRLSISLPQIDLTVHLSKIANKANVSKRSLQRALEMISIIKDNPISCGKDPTAISIAVLYGACLEMKEKVSQSQIADAGDMSIVTLRKRFLDVKKIFDYLPNNSQIA